jgi:hypothetical protein
MGVVAFIGIALGGGILTARMWPKVKLYRNLAKEHAASAAVWESDALTGDEVSRPHIMRARRPVAEHYRALQHKYERLTWRPWEYCPPDLPPPFPK